MNEQTADFFLGSREDRDLFQHPRACTVLRQIKRRRASDVMLVRVDPPLQEEEFSVPGVVIDQAPHVVGDEMFPISRWPMHVYVARSHAEHPEELDFLEDAESDVLAWGELYRVRAELPGRF